jgi:hypothetical protein
MVRIGRLLSLSLSLCLWVGRAGAEEALTLAVDGATPVAASVGRAATVAVSGQCAAAPLGAETRWWWWVRTLERKDRFGRWYALTETQGEASFLPGAGARAVLTVTPRLTGECRATVEARCLAAESAGWREVGAGELVVPLTVAAAPNVRGAITGTVRDESSGAALVMQVIATRWPAGDGERRVWSAQPDGAFTLSALTPGEWQLDVVPRSGYTDQDPAPCLVEVVDEAPVRVALTMGKGLDGVHGRLELRGWGGQRPKPKPDPAPARAPILSSSPALGARAIVAVPVTHGGFEPDDRLVFDHAPGVSVVRYVAVVTHAGVAATRPAYDWVPPRPNGILEVWREPGSNQQSVPLNDGTGRWRTTIPLGWWDAINSFYNGRYRLTVFSDVQRPNGRVVPRTDMAEFPLRNFVLRDIQTTSGRPDYVVLGAPLSTLSATSAAPKVSFTIRDDGGNYVTPGGQTLTYAWRLNVGGKLFKGQRTGPGAVVCDLGDTSTWEDPSADLPRGAHTVRLAVAKGDSGCDLQYGWSRDLENDYFGEEGRLRCLRPLVPGERTHKVDLEFRHVATGRWEAWVTYRLPEDMAAVKVDLVDPLGRVYGPFGAPPLALLANGVAQPVTVKTATLTTAQVHAGEWAAVVRAWDARSACDDEPWHYRTHEVNKHFESAIGRRVAWPLWLHIDGVPSDQQEEPGARVPYNVGYQEGGPEIDAAKDGIKPDDGHLRKAWIQIHGPVRGAWCLGWSGAGGAGLKVWRQRGTAWEPVQAGSEPDGMQDYPVGIHRIELRLEGIRGSTEMRDIRLDLQLRYEPGNPLALLARSTATATVEEAGLRDVTFLPADSHGPWPVARDRPHPGKGGLSYYGTPHWRDANQPPDHDANDPPAGADPEAGDHRWPVCYGMTGTSSQSAAGKLCVRATLALPPREPANNGAVSWTVVGTTSNGLRLTGAPCTPSQGLATVELRGDWTRRAIRHLPQFRIDFTATPSNGDPPVTVGPSSNEVFIIQSFGQPGTSPLYHTVLYHGCKWAETAGSVRRWTNVAEQVAIADAIFAEFQDLDVRRVPEPNAPASAASLEPMWYYRRWPIEGDQQSPAYDVAGLLAKGDGTCDAWCAIFEDMLNLHEVLATPPIGLAALPSGIYHWTPEAAFSGAKYLIVKSWSLPATPSVAWQILNGYVCKWRATRASNWFVPVGGHFEYGWVWPTDIAYRPGVVAGQGPNAYPAAIFDNHALVAYRPATPGTPTIYYDPSYGRRLSVPLRGAVADHDWMVSELDALAIVEPGSQTLWCCEVP